MIIKIFIHEFYEFIDERMRNFMRNKILQIILIWYWNDIFTNIWFESGGK